MRLFLTPMAIVMLATSVYGSVMIPVVNPSFETDLAAPNTFPTFSVVSGWTTVDPAGILPNSGNAIGVINPTGSTFYPDGAPDGNNALIIFLEGDIGAGPVSQTQVLTTNLEANTRYTLSVEVGNIASGTGSPPFEDFGFFNLMGFPGYMVQLLAGGVVIAEDDNSMFGSIPEGEFRNTTIEVEIPETHAQLGQALEIRLTNLNEQDTPENPGIEVNFDDVRLESMAIPEPASSMLLFLAALFVCPRRPFRA